MDHEVMTHLDVEDRPFFGLTVRQFATVFGAAFIAMFLYAIGLAWLPDIPRLIICALVILPVIVTALIQIDGTPIITWTLDRFLFSLQGSVAIFGWRDYQEDHKSEERGY